jgi:hypothetical protein
MNTTRTALTIALALSLLSRQVAAAPPPTVAPPPAAPAAPATPADTPESRVAALRERGNEAMVAMRYTDALAAYQQAVALAPDDAGLYYSLARANQLLGNFPASLTSLEAFEKKASPEAKAKVGSLDTLYAQLRPRVATLRVSCDVAGARVLLNEKLLGTTPLDAQRVVAGAATLRVEQDGYFVESRSVTLPGGGELALELVMHPKATSGLLVVRTTPPGATVTVDGRDIGTSSPRVEVLVGAGSHELRARLDGYKDATVPVVLAAGVTREVPLTLDKQASVFGKWWFWTGVTAVVAGGVVLTYALLTERGADRGTFSPGTVGGP